MISLKQTNDYIISTAGVRESVPSAVFLLKGGVEAMKKMAMDNARDLELKWGTPKPSIKYIYI